MAFQSHQLEVDGVIYRELKTLNRVVIQDGPDAGYDELILVHTRSMGDKIYTVHKTNQQIIELIQANKMNLSELSTFQKVWEEHNMTIKMFPRNSVIPRKGMLYVFNKIYIYFFNDIIHIFKN